MSLQSIRNLNLFATLVTGYIGIMSCEKDDTIFMLELGAEALSGDRAMLLAIKNDIHNALYALANSAMLNGVKSTTVVSTVEVMTPWRVAYTACEYAFGALAALSLVFWVVSKATSKGGRKA